MSVYRFGIIGCGLISRFAAAALAEIPEAKLTVVSSRTEANRRKLMDQYDCDGVSSHEELVRREDVDVVIICTPSGAHLEPCIAAAEAKKHVIVEKPLEITLPRIDAMIRACDENNVGLCGLFPYRFTKGAQALKRAVEQGRFGRITVGDCYNKWWREQSYYDNGAWRGTWKLDGGGAAMNQGSHAIDLLQWYMGPVTSVFGFADCLAHKDIEVEDTQVAAVRYASGAMGVIECATSAWPGLERKVEIHGDRGSVVMENERFSKWEFAEVRPEDEEIRQTLGTAGGKPVVGAADPAAITHANHREQFKDFIQSLETHRKPLVDGHEGRKAIELILAIYQSARSGEMVGLPLK